MARVMKVVFLTVLPETGGPVTGFINVLQEGREGEKQGELQELTTFGKNGRNGQHPRV